MYLEAEGRRRSIYPVFPADIVQAASVAVGLRPGSTYIPPVINKTVAEVTPLLWRNDFPKLHLHLFRLLHILYKANPVTKAYTVSICNNRRLSKDITHNQIRTFPSYARKPKQSIKIIRYMAAILVPQYFHTGAYIPCLAFPEAAGLHNRLNIRRVGISQCINIRIFCVKIFHDHIYPRVSALGRKTDTYQKLPRLIIVKRTSRIGILFL